MSNDGPRGKDKADSDAFAATLASTGEQAVSTADTYAAGHELAESSTLAAHTTGAPSIDLRAARLEHYQFTERYELRTELGKGGMGRVQLCNDAVVGRSVAMKMIHNHHRASADWLGRFLREARVQGQLEHPAIVPVYDLGVDTDGNPYFTMKRLKGKTLHEILRGLRDGDTEIAAGHSTRKLLTEFTNVCQAIEFAHSRGVVHRDLKPDNIMLGHFGEVYVLDWGIAKIAGVDDDSAPEAGTSMRIDTGEITTEQTAFGAVLGTPGYMAPEQLRGDVDAIDTAADIYALGAILFEMLTLEQLHQGKTAQELLASTRHGADATASARAADREIPPELDAICVKATAMEPRERYGSVRELRAAVEAYLDGDRDLARRQQLAMEHARRAETAAGSVLSGADDSADTRRAAFRDASRALALDPTNESAAQVVSQLMLTPPRQLPVQVEADLRASLDQRTILHVRGAAIVYLASVLFVPLYMWMGIRDWTLGSLTIASMLACAGVAGYIGFVVKKLTSRWMAAAIAVNLVFLVLASRAFGPFILLPALAATSTIAFLLHAHLSNVAFAIAAGCAGVLLPVGLELSGVWPRSYQFADGAMVVSSHMFVLRETQSYIIFTSAVVATIVAVSVLVLNNRKEQVNSERQLHLQTWQLGQLIPERQQR